MLNQLMAFLDSNQIKYASLDNKNILTFSVKIEKGHVQCFADMDETAKRFLFYTLYGIVIPEKKRALVCELLTRINYNVILGNFEMDMDEGEVRYKTSINYEGGKLTHKFIENIISTNLWMINSFFATILEAMNSALSAKELFEKYHKLSQ